ncbi:glycosyltransferase family 2 protein [Clostridium sp. YIM B02505]|uniref:Glycosyltransferase family 2 protein n=1 Tax=Clostridium yunnanense TaxID=2800325 RepID=A0ABS1EPA4_9CLOT|nr:glycosyltransferase family 2 protein [Clostridium yunnanense]MBK1811221.1 glycosyltransferase family 2 protein [Clostridium yunnanense]
MENKIEVSVIIPTYCREAALEMTLIGFAKQDFKDFEIIIVNDGGNLDVKKIVNLYKNRLRIKYYYQDNQGRSAARNEALKHVEGRYIIFNDDDRIPEKSFVRNHYDKLRENQNQVIIGHKKEILAFYSPELNLREEKLRTLYKRNTKCFEKMYGSDLNQMISLIDLENDFDNVIESWSLGDTDDNITVADDYVYKDIHNFKLGWMIATTANMSYDRSGFEDVRFDTSYVGWGVEDNDFAYQLKLKGNEIIYTDEAVNYHIIHNKNGDPFNELRENVKRICDKYNDFETNLFATVSKEVIYLDEAQSLRNYVKNKTEMESIVLKLIKKINNSY